ncbi:MAG: DEAD/DEAH box helicase, partial [Silvanigrellales bacterium]|nr:DEAD/DEAH box helicase [Silvanigrellales bacterium]
MVAHAGLLPARLALDCKQEAEALVRALVSARRAEASAEMLRCLLEDEPILKGPFVVLGLPFASPKETPWPLAPELAQKFPPYAHQLQAFERLKGPTPSNTLVTTGTGSGKTECFLLPILDYVFQCKKERKGQGVKALLLYPMNALIDDQSERLAGLVHRLNEHLPEGQGIRVGRYTGDQGFQAHMSKHKVIDKREALCLEPPDIVLTNTRMLDFMLFRPEEQAFWDGATKEVFRYLVLDELHTFEGAQGADVACLLRRFRLKLEGAAFACVGTSATVGSKDSEQQLCAFAETLFGDAFNVNSVVLEQREQLDALFPLAESQPLPVSSSPSPALEEALRALASGEVQSHAAYLKALCEAWQAPLDPVERGQWMQRHSLARTLVEKALGHRGVSLAELAKHCGLSEGLVAEFLDLLASSRRAIGPDAFGPLVFMQTQLWVGDSGALVRKLTPGGGFLSSFERDAEALRRCLPAIFCNECGAAGWAADTRPLRGKKREWAVSSQVRASFKAHAKGSATYLFNVPEAPSEHTLVHYDAASGVLRGASEQEAKEGAGSQNYFVAVAPRNRESQKGTAKGSLQAAHKTEHLNDYLGVTSELNGQCPACEASLTVRTTGVSQTLLGSVLVQFFLSHGANPNDKKCLVFGDSVQDAAHMAGFLGARAFRFNWRRQLVRFFEGASAASGSAQASVDASALSAALLRNVETLWAKANDAPRDEEKRQHRKELFAWLPKDLWELWKGSGLKAPLQEPGCLEELKTRLLFETWSELCTARGLGWSLRKAGLLSWEPKLETLDAWCQLLAQVAEAQGQLPELAALRNPGSPETRAFVYGLLERLVSKGCVFVPELKDAYERTGELNLYVFRQKNPTFDAVFPTSSAQPQTLLLQSSEDSSSKQKKSKPTLIGKSAEGTWFQKWTKKFLHTDTEQSADAEQKANVGKKAACLASALLVQLFKEAARHPKATALRVRSERHDNEFVLEPTALEVTRPHFGTLVCGTCRHVARMPANTRVLEQPCTMARCQGRMTLAGANDAGDASPTASFERYLQSSLRRRPEATFSHAHTGALSGRDRNRVEQAFKLGLVPGQSLGSNERYADHPINVLACTPTLEMGIDIGTLSGVFLRGLPATLAGVVQRLGRAGRSSGNAFNVVLFKRTPHDRHFWKNPPLILQGKVDVPGCEFRTVEFLRRQFHAYVFDLFATHAPQLSIPKVADLKTGVSFHQMPYCVSLQSFLQALDAEACVQSFLEAMFPESQKASLEFTEIKQALVDDLCSGTFQQNVFRVLEGMQERHNRESELASKEATEIENTRAAKQGDALPSEREQELQSERRRRQKIWIQRQRQNREYLLTLLAEEGILPNYAFPSEGVNLTATIEPVQRNREAFGSALSLPRKKRRIEAVASRPLPAALKDFAPGASFYMDGYKVPITRYGVGGVQGALAPVLERVVLCDACGSAHFPLHGTPGDKMACVYCGAPEQVLREALRPKEVVGQGRFQCAQIRDDEDERQRPQVLLKTYVSFRGESHPNAPAVQTWASQEARVGIEVRRRATITTAVLGKQDDFGLQDF